MPPTCVLLRLNGETRNKRAGIQGAQPRAFSFHMAHQATRRCAEGSARPMAQRKTKVCRFRAQTQRTLPEPAARHRRLWRRRVASGRARLVSGVQRDRTDQSAAEIGVTRPSLLFPTTIHPSVVRTDGEKRLVGRKAREQTNILFAWSLGGGQCVFMS